MSSEKSHPSTRPFHRKGKAGGGYCLPQCPDCGKRWRKVKGGGPKEPEPGAPCYLRALISPQTKSWVIEEARTHGLSLSALIRQILLDYQSRQQS